MAKHVFVTGGVVSSLGKGLTSASVGMLLDPRALVAAPWLVAGALVAAVTAALPALVASQGSKTTDAAVAAITKLENDSIKANLANDSSFYESFYASDYTGGSSFGTWSTKASELADMKDTKKTMWNSASLSDVKVRVHGDLAVDTYRLTYDATLGGQHYARTVMCTHTLQQQNGSWVNPKERWMEGDPNLSTAYALLALKYCEPTAAH